MQLPHESNIVRLCDNVQKHLVSYATTNIWCFMQPTCKQQAVFVYVRILAVKLISFAAFYGTSYYLSKGEIFQLLIMVNVLTIYHVKIIDRYKTRVHYF